MLTKVTIAKKMAVPSDRAWEAISKIGRLDVWFPAIAICTVEGSLRQGAAWARTISRRGSSLAWQAGRRRKASFTYVAPAGQKREYVERALRVLEQYLPEQQRAAV